MTRSPHFVLTADVEAAKAETLLRYLEMTFGRVLRFCEEYSLTVASPSGRMQVFCFSRRGDFEKFARPFVENVGLISGFYERRSKRLYFQDAHDRLVRVTLQHEAAHQVIDHLCPALGRRMPEWLSEGWACAFEVDMLAGVEGYRAYNSWRAQDFSSFVTEAIGGRAADEIRRTVIGGHDQGIDGVACSVRYALSWSIVYHLQTDRHEALGRYLQDLADAPADLSAKEAHKMWEKHFGPVDDAFAGRVIQSLADARRAAIRSNPSSERPNH